MTPIDLDPQTKRWLNPNGLEQLLWRGVVLRQPTSFVSYAYLWFELLLPTCFKEN